MLKGRILSLLCCILMMCAAALCVNKMIFGQSLSGPSRSAQTSDNASVEKEAISTLPDGIVMISTGSICKTAGYAGLVPLEVYIKNDTISKITPLDNKETPSFFKRASSVIDKWEGVNVEEAENITVDAVSGATYSSLAINDNVKAALAAYSHHKVSTQTTELPVKLWVAFAVTLIACILPLFVKNKIYHNIQLIANVLVLGFWTGQFIDYSVMIKFLSTGMAFPAALTAAAMLVAAFIYPLFGKAQHYCNHICPLGSAQQLINNMSRIKVRLDVSVIKALNWFRKILWAVLMLLLWADVATEWMDFEVFQAFIVVAAPWPILVAAGVFLLLSFVVNRPYCNFVCPTGSLIKRSENID